MKDQSILIALQLYSQNTLRIMNSQQCVQADKYLSKILQHCTTVNTIMLCKWKVRHPIVHIIYPRQTLMSMLHLQKVLYHLHGNVQGLSHIHHKAWQWLLNKVNWRRSLVQTKVGHAPLSTNSPLNSK